MSTDSSDWRDSKKRFSALTELDVDSINGIVSNPANLYEDGNLIWRQFTMLRYSAQHRWILRMQLARSPTHFTASPDSAHSTQKHPPNIVFTNPLLIYKSSYLSERFAVSTKYSLLYGLRKEKRHGRIFQRQRARREG